MEDTLQGVKDLCLKLSDMRSEYDSKNAELKEFGKQIDQLEFQLIGILEKLDVKTFDWGGGTISRSERFSVRVPQGDDKLTFFKYLESRGIKDELTTVNSQTLNSWYKREAEIAMEEGRPFMPEGLGMPTSQAILSMRKKK